MTTFMGTDADRARKLGLARDAAASAVLNGCTEDEVLAAVREGLAEAERLNGIGTNAAPAPDEVSPVPVPAPRSGALASWAAAVGG